MTDFRDIGVHDKIADAIREIGWNEPTPIQLAAVPEGLSGRDVFAQAQTGTGKTGAYAMIVLGRVASGAKKPSVLVLAPTRELANQIDLEFCRLSRYSHHRSVAVYGGASISDQIYKLRKGADIIVGTPGRIKDMIERGFLDLSLVKETVLDEADRMLDMGFSEELDFIMSKVPEERQTLLFSATMSKEIKKLAMRYMNEPKEILVSKDEPCSDLTTQYFVPVSRSDKRECLHRIIENGNPKTIVFCQTKKMVDELFEDFSKVYKAGSIHGDMPQNKREKVMRNFRNDKFSILIATDVAARGLDVQNIDCVVNYDIPNDPETYLHRIGRTGRAGKEGVAISFVTKRENSYVREFERATGKKISKMYIDEMPKMEKKEEPIQAVVVERKHEEQRFEEKKLPKMKAIVSKGGKKDMIVLKINLGKDDGVGRVQITELIKYQANLGDEDVGTVGLGSSASYVEVSFDHVEYVIDSLNGYKTNEKRVFVQIAPKKAPYPGKRKGVVRTSETNASCVTAE